MTASGRDRSPTLGPRRRALELGKLWT